MIRSQRVHWPRRYRSKFNPTSYIREINPDHVTQYLTILTFQLKETPWTHAATPRTISMWLNRPSEFYVRACEKFQEGCVLTAYYRAPHPKRTRYYAFSIRIRRDMTVDPLVWGYDGQEFVQELFDDLAGRRKIMGQRIKREQRIVKIVERFYLRKQHSTQRHSMVVFEYGGKLFMLDRIIDSSTKSYMLFGRSDDPALANQPRVFPKLIPVSGQGRWGEGVTWDKAYQMAKTSIIFQKLVNS